MPGTLGKALERSNRIMAEDLLREAGYMLPQSGNVYTLLEEMRVHAAEPGFPADALELLLSSLEFNEPINKKEEEIMEKWKCYIGTSLRHLYHCCFHFSAFSISMGL